MPRQRWLTRRGGSLGDLVAARVAARGITRMSELRRVRGLMGGRGSVGPGRHRGWSCAWRIRESVTGREAGEAAEAIFQPNQTYIDVLTDVLRLEEKRCGQSDVAQSP